MTTKAIGYVHGEFVHARFMRAVLDAENYEDALVLDAEGLNIADARNNLVRKFLDSGLEWLYMADTDTVFAPNVISRLMLHADPDHLIVSGLIYVDGRPPFPMMYSRIADTAAGFGMFKSISEWPHGQCIKVDAVGAGCLLVHRDAYLEIEKRFPNRAAPWFDYAIISGMRIGEDIMFCVRAKDAGLKIYTDTSTRVGHIKPRVI
jgi:GT2 family glycosyltransferase